MTIDAIVLLPDHWHMMWTLPRGDTEYSKRIGWIKKEFTKRWLESGGSENSVSQGPVGQAVPDMGNRKAISVRHSLTYGSPRPPSGRTRISLHDFPSIPNPTDRRHKQPTDGNLNVSSLEVGQHTGA